MLKLDAASEMAEADLNEMKNSIRRCCAKLRARARGYAFARAGWESLYFCQSWRYQRNQEQESVRLVTHEVKRGETLASIAARYGQAVSSLMELNGLTTARLQIGQKLRVIFEGIRGTLR